MALLLVAACSGDSSVGSDPTSELGPPSEASGFPVGWSPDELDWQRCDGAAGQLQCTSLEVPLDWSAPDGTTIELDLARTRATGDRIGSLLTNPGGPGGSGVEFVAHGALGGRLAESFDIVSWDPRGVGGSSALDCEDHTAALYSRDPTPDTDAEAIEAAEVAAAVAADCAASGGEALEHLNTEVVARDMEAIRMALGGGELNYIGFSYGTHIGQEYAELFGERIRAMVLDGVVDPSAGFEEFLLGQAEAFDATFERQGQACADAGPTVCGVRDLTDAYDELMALAEGEVPDGGDPYRGRTETAPTPAEVVLAATYTGYLNEGWAQLGPALRRALSGDPTSISALAASYVGLTDYGPYAAVVCTDSEHPTGAEAYREFTARAREVSERFGPAVAGEMAPCATWAVPPQDRAEALSAPGAPPILVVGNTGDPATPLANAEAVAENLTSGVLLVVESDGHVAHGSNACATEVIDAYLESLELPEPGARC